MELLIRKYSESDVIPLWQILEPVAMGSALFPYPLQSLQDCRSLLHRQRLCLVAQVQGRVQGVLLLRSMGEGGWQQFATVELVVAAEWQRQQIGTALIAQAKHIAAALHYNGILLSPLPEETQIFAFFSSQGFDTAGVLPGAGAQQTVLFWECPKRATKTKNKTELPNLQNKQHR